MFQVRERCEWLPVLSTQFTGPWPQHRGPLARLSHALTLLQSKVPTWWHAQTLHPDEKHANTTPSSHSAATQPSTGQLHGGSGGWNVEDKNKISMG